VTNPTTVFCRDGKAEFSCGRACFQGDFEDKVSVLSLPPEVGMGNHQPLKDVVLRKWMGVGLLRGKRQTKQWCIAEDEVVRFRSTYCLAQEACRLASVDPRSLAGRDGGSAYGNGRTRPDFFLPRDISWLLTARRRSRGRFSSMTRVRMEPDRD
jgi:hypothetical protein